VTVAIGGGAVVAPRLISRPSTVPTAMVGGSPTTNVVTSSPTAATSSTIGFSLPPASASIAPPPTPPNATMIVPPNPDDEVRKLERAQNALATDPANALSLCNDDVIIFPHGPNAQEREVIAIDALTRLGKMSDAKARAKKFERDFPSSPDIPHIHTLIGQN
jgi:hypothetical protein